MAVSTTVFSGSLVIYPELNGKLYRHAVRAPVLNASLTDCVFELQRETTAEEVHRLFAETAQGSWAGTVGCEERPPIRCSNR